MPCFFTTWTKPETQIECPCTKAAPRHQARNGSCLSSFATRISVRDRIIVSLPRWRGDAGIGFDTGRTPEASYFDLAARWNITDNFTITGNVDNVTDETPPQTLDGAFGGQANTDVQVYRVLGRTFSISGRYRF